jgi:signal transduction histidine kinase
MRWERVTQWLMPGAMEDGEGFRQEILSASHRGARVVAVAEVAAAAAAFMGLMPRLPAFGLAVLAAVTFGATLIPAAYPYNRLLASLSCLVGAAIPLRAIQSGADVDYALATATLLILIAVAVLPLRPLDGLAIGIGVFIAGIHCGHELFLAMLTLAAGCIAATLYGQRSNAYRLYLGTLTMTAELRDLQAQAMRSESSDTMVRLTAALAHELSSPLGALSSGIDMLLSLGDRPKPESAAAQARLAVVQADLRRSTRDSLERLRKTVNRIQRLTNFDEAATQQANLNELVNEAVGLVRPQSPEGTRFELDLQPIPNVTCRPQRLLAVLCSVLSNSVQALNGDGRITVSTALRDSVLELRIEDNGRGIPAEHMAHIFDPRFQVAEGRVSTGNWSLFTSRQYMKEHSGDIRIQSTEGRGTSVCLTLPSTS